MPEGQSLEIETERSVPFGQQVFRPIPDPTVLTNRAVDIAKEDMRRELQALKSILETRLDGLERLASERFRAIAMQFTERDMRTEQMAIATKTAIEAALQAQKEAGGKSEAAFSKQMDQLTELFRTAMSGMGEQFSDMKGRVLLIEGRTAGIASAQASQQSMISRDQGSHSNVIGLVGLVVGSLIAIGSLIIAMLKG